MRISTTVAFFSALVLGSLPAWAGSTQKSYPRDGIASFYDNCGSPLANGKRLRCGALTAAHRSLPFGTMVRVTNKRNGRTIVVRINDRRPYVRGRIIDLTPAGAHKLLLDGLAKVHIEVVGRQ